MNLSEFAFKVIFIFIPGLIVFKIVDKLTFHKESKTPDILLGSLTYGFVCYLIYDLLFVLIPNKLPFLPKQKFYFEEIITNTQSKLSFYEIFVTTLLAIPLGFILVSLAHHKILFKTARKLKISDKLDDIGLWNETLESSVNRWVVIRDIPNDLMYRGCVHSFSEGLDSNEILLEDVDVYKNSDSCHLYSVPGLYFFLNKEDGLRIELQSWEITKKICNNFTKD
jgi:hypothetical protein